MQVARGEHSNGKRVDGTNEGREGMDRGRDLRSREGGEKPGTENR